MVTAVLFDLDETLLDRSVSLRAFLHDQVARFKADLGHPDMDGWVERFIVLDERGSVPKSKVYPALLSEFGGRADAADALLTDYEVNCCKHALSFAGMADVLRELRRRGKRLGIVTNGQSAFQRRHLDALALLPLVDQVLISEEEGLRKPDAKLFLRAALRLGDEPSSCLFVGDNPFADVLGAAASGMRTLWFRCGQAWPRDLPPNPGPTIERLEEVLSFAV